MVATNQEPLKVGDRVQVTVSEANSARVNNGDRGTVVGVRSRHKPKKKDDPPATRYYDVKMDEYRGPQRETGVERDWGFTGDNLVKLKKADEPKPVKEVPEGDGKSEEKPEG